jgi:hypothetical protein
MESWTRVRFSLKDVEDGVATALLRDFLSLNLEDLREIGVFSSELGYDGKCLYFSPLAARAFASGLAKLPVELCDPPKPETVLCLYGSAGCLPVPGKPVGSPATDPPPPEPPHLLDRLVEPPEDHSSNEAGWSSVQSEIARLLPEIAREESPPPSPVGEDPDLPSKTYRLLRAALIVSTAAVIIAVISPYLAWFVALIAW